MEDLMDKNKKFISEFQVEEVKFLSDILHWNKKQTWKEKKERKSREVRKAGSENVGFASQIQHGSNVCFYGN